MVLRLMDRTMLNGGAVLQDALHLINGSRQEQYGPPVESFERIAVMWTAYLRHPVTARDVCLLMALLKIAREAHGHKADNLVDAAGYVGLAEDMEEGQA
jgi:hypothetical protein